MPRRLVLAAAAAALLLPLAPSRVAAAETGPRLKVLFLGDRGHHQPADRAAQLVPIMAGRGIDITYTESTADLNAANLAKYDVLLIYANTTRIEPDQEKALLEYVEGGGGFVPLHCASYCFLNSEAYVKLVGAQFQRHGTGEFETKIVDPEHPIMSGFQPFRTWDETYVHTRHNEQGRHVLQVRAEGDRDEPWTWVRTQGKGRVFYTAYGHDYRTWTEPSFQDLVERGIRWASGKGPVMDSRPRVAAGLKPFEYEPSQANIPNYLPASQWGTQGKPFNSMQKPLPVDESIKHLVVPPGFEPRLFAAEPQIAKPIAMAWDHRGRLWVGETVDYPNNLQHQGEGHDRISILEDTDDDGRADKFTVFADKLSIPSSITFANGGVILTQVPDILFLKDTDGDDKADVRKVLFTGWGTQDTHAGPSNLRYGFDNWIWGIVGYSGFHGTVGGEPLDFRQAFYRFKPDGSKLEFLRNTNNNSWGVGFSEDGLVFGSTANGCPSVYLPIPNRYYEKVRGFSPRVLRMISDSYRFYPITDKVRQVDWFGGFTAGAGHALYTARTYPSQYWNSTAFVNEPTGHLTATFTLQRKGTDVTAHYGWNLVASNDEWTAPIVAEVGPDGHVWVIDWYNYIVQHNPTPQGFRTGKGNAYETPLRDKTHGRIYRIVYKDAPKARRVALNPDEPKTLVEGLKNDNMFWRLTAQRLLMERGKADVAAELVGLVNDRSTDAIGLNPGAIHALWAMHGLRMLDGSNERALAAATQALEHPSAGVRRNALQVLPASDETAKKIVAARLLNDPDAQVRLAALLALVEQSPSDAVAEALVKLLVTGSVEGDHWLTDALTAAGAAHDRFFLSRLAAHRFERPAGATVLTVASRVAEHYARGGPADTVAALVRSLQESDTKLADTIILGLGRGWTSKNGPQLDEPTEAALARLMARLSPEAQGSLVNLASRWGSKGLEKYAGEISASLLATVKDATKTDSARVDAARQLVEFRKTDPAPARELLELVTPRTSPALATGLVEALGRSESAEVGTELVNGLAAFTPSVRPVALRVILSRADWTLTLLRGAEDGKLALDQLTLDQQQALTTHRNRAVAGRARRLLGRGLPDADRQKVIDALAPVVLKGGDPAKGKDIFKQQCAKCHTLQGEGGKVGPDLTGMAAHPKDELLIHILDPSRSVEGNFVQYTLATTDGRVLNGLLASESRTGVELLDAEGKSHSILREDIDELTSSRKSLMPEGFEKQINPEGMTDLLAYLTQRGKYLPLDLRKVATIVSTRGMFYDKNSPVERLVFSDWGPKTFEGVPFLLVDPRGDRVPNVIMLNGPLGAFPPEMPRAVSVPCHSGAKAIHLLSGVSGWGYAGGTPPETVSMIVRLHYADGQQEDHPLRNGIHFADYIRPVDVPGSKLAFRLRGQQIRYLALTPKRTEAIDTIEFIKGGDDTAPVVMAVTVEVAE